MQRRVGQFEKDDPEPVDLVAERPRGVPTARAFSATAPLRGRDRIHVGFDAPIPSRCIASMARTRVMSQPSAGGFRTF